MNFKGNPCTILIDEEIANAEDFVMKQNFNVDNRIGIRSGMNIFI